MTARAARSIDIDLARTDAEARPSLRQRGATKSVEAYSQVQIYLLEAGELQVTLQWQWVELEEVFLHTIVIANAISTNGAALVLISIRHVEPTGFESRLPQQDDASGILPPAVASFIALARGTYTMIDDVLVEAGRVEAKLSGTSHVLPCSHPFNYIPVAMTTATSVNDVKPVNSRVQAQ
jgi:hypothetical protein